MIEQINTVIYSVVGPRLRQLQSVTVCGWTIGSWHAICSVGCAVLTPRHLEGGHRTWVTKSALDLMMTMSMMAHRYYLFCRTLQPECVWLCDSVYTCIWSTAFTKQSLSKNPRNVKHVLSSSNYSLRSFCWHYPGVLFMFRGNENAIKPLAVKTSKPLIFEITLIANWHKKHSS